MNPAIPIAAALTASPEPSIPHQVDVVAAVIAAEARSEGWKGMAAVAQSIRNRGGSPFAQVTKRGQYECLIGVAPVTLVRRMMGQKGWIEARFLADWVIEKKPALSSGYPIHGATHFHDTSIRTPKGWGRCLAKVGKLRFYRVH